MNRSARSLLAVILFFTFSGCTKSKEVHTTPDNGFVLNGRFMGTDYAVRKNWTGGNEIAFTDISPIKSFSGHAHTVQFLLDTLISNSTYTFMPADAAGFDKTKHFDVALFYNDVVYHAGQELNGTGEILSKPTAGSLTVTQGHQHPSFRYTLQFGEIIVRGSYQGAVTVIE
jgi:hypothetical protein